MRDFLPRRPTGFDAEARFDQAVWDRTHGPAAQINSSSTVRVSKTSKGLFLHSAPAGGRGAGLAVPYCITALYTSHVTIKVEYFGARPWNPATQQASGTEIKIAKCLTARMPASETIDSVDFTYSYASDDNHRTQLMSEAIYEYHVLHPRYRMGDVVYAIRIRGGTGVRDDHNSMIQWAEISPHRFWVYQFDQAGPPAP